MVGGTIFHRGILAASLGRMSKKQKQQQKQNLHERKTKTFHRPRVS
jgi:hypothetical protein